MGWFSRAAQAYSESVRRVWGSNYPKRWWIFNAVGGALAAALFVAFGLDGEIGLKIGVFFGAWACAALALFGFTYGVVRARNAWPKGGGPQGSGFR